MVIDVFRLGIKRDDKVIENVRLKIGSFYLYIERRIYNLGVYVYSNAGGVRFTVGVI